jgi:UDP-glucose 4-epimerase
MDDTITLIIGKRSNLSKSLSNAIDNSILISSSDIVSNINILSNYTNNKLNIIFNNFQVSTMLNDNINYEKYIQNTILNTSKILTYIQINNIQVNKIIYTSSSSVYGNNRYCTENDIVSPINLQGSLKVANEELIKRFCNLNKFKYTIVRLFNMYGGNDSFSIVSKIKNVYINSEILNIINDGNAIRDYIHIDNVVSIYDKLINKIDKIPTILNIASGHRTKVSDILKYLDNKNIIIKTNNIKRDEIDISIANIDVLKNIIDTKDFIKVDSFLEKEIKNI